MVLTLIAVHAAHVLEHGDDVSGDNNSSNIPFTVG
jgi:hypothetical protein